MSVRALVVACLATAVVGGVIGGVIANALNSPSSGTPASSTSGSASPTGSASPAAATQAQSCPVTKIAEDDLPSVVTLSVKGQSASGTGSGEVIRPDGYILTNNHVIAAAASGGSISVLFSDGTTAAATLVGRDPLTDVAVIKVSNQSNLRAIPLGSSSDLVVGQAVVALGAPSACPAR